MNGRRAKAERRAGLRSGRRPEPRRVELTAEQALKVKGALERKARMR